ncbi:MAG: hypothetical protein NTY60_09940 [Proteobacteria bacterium]|nr:hypothetical protein [Pseudomonadota bacterium]
MSSTETKPSAEQRFRAAFDRLKLGRSERLPKDTPVSQNNVAKEAGCDPTALRKSRFPSLVAEIQHYVETHKEDVPVSERQQLLKRRRRNRDTKETISDLKQQRDASAGLLADANLLIVDLTEELADVHRMLDELRRITKPSAATISFSKRSD